MGLDLYSHNITPYNNLKDLPLGENAIYVTATGTGKSFVAGKLILENMDASSKAKQRLSKS